MYLTGLVFVWSASAWLNTGVRFDYATSFFFSIDCSQARPTTDRGEVRELFYSRFSVPKFRASQAYQILYLYLFFTDFLIFERSSE